jgi:hAT family C-terminal dimerisation region
MKRFSPLEPLQSSKPVQDEPENDDSLQKFFRENFRQPMAMSTQPGKTDDDIKQKIFNLANQAPINLSENVLQNWERRRYDDANLFQISQIILAVPPTQVSVERAFSALGLVLTARRNRLADKTIDDLLVCKLNVEIFDRI